VSKSACVRQKGREQPENPIHNVQQSTPVERNIGRRLACGIGLWDYPDFREKRTLSAKDKDRLMQPRYNRKNRHNSPNFPNLL
jgi:hypothetical protein